MAGRTITRADLANAVYQKVKISRAESADLLDQVNQRHQHEENTQDAQENHGELAGEIEIQRHAAASGRAVRARRDRPAQASINTAIEELERTISVVRETLSESE